jgi:hypothetical protein
MFKLKFSTTSSFGMIVFDIFALTEQIQKIFDMNDLILTQVLPFSGMKDELPIWREKFLAKANRSGFKDVLLAKVNIPKSDEDINMKRLKK